jgi:Ca2+-binding EF-hand superfamily protein
MDKNSDGIVNDKELAVYLDPRHEQHAANEAAYLISVADKDKDNKLSEREMLTNYQLFTGSSLSNFAGVLHDEF